MPRYDEDLKIEPDPLHWSIPRERTGSERLWISVLYRAVFDVLSSDPFARGYNEAVKTEVVHWFFVDVREDSPGSLKWICQHVGLNEHAVRHAMLEAMCDREQREKVAKALYFKPRMPSKPKNRL